MIGTTLGHERWSSLLNRSYSEYIDISIQEGECNSPTFHLLVSSLVPECFPPTWILCCFWEVFVEKHGAIP